MNLLTIAGFDPSGGAGVLLDTAVFRALGFGGAAVLTAVTAQNTTSVFSVKPLPVRFLRDQLKVLENDVCFAGLKVGMAGTTANLEEIGRMLDKHGGIPRVIDPVFRSSSGRLLGGPVAGATVCRLFRRRAAVLTPNLGEAARLSGRPVRTVADMETAARIISERTESPCLIKGGHLAGDPVNLLFDGKRIILFGHRRIRRDVHGTGCFFSAVLLGFLVRTGDLAEAAKSATDWTHRAIRAAAPLGRGRAILSPECLPRR